MSKLLREFFWGEFCLRKDGAVFDMIWKIEKHSYTFKKRQGRTCRLGRDGGSTCLLFILHWRDEYGFEESIVHAIFSL